MTCAECDSLLIEHAYGELSPGSARAMEDHLATCERCSRAHAEIQRTLMAVRSLPEEKPSEAGVPELLALAREVARAAGTRQRERTGFLPAWVDHLLFRPGWALATAAVIVGIFSVAVLGLGSRAPVERSQVPTATATAPPPAAAPLPAVVQPVPMAQLKKDEDVEAQAERRKLGGARYDRLQAPASEAAGSAVGLTQDAASEQGFASGKGSGALGALAGAEASRPERQPEAAAATRFEAKAKKAMLEPSDSERDLYAPSAPPPGTAPLAPAAAAPKAEAEMREEATNRAADHADRVSAAAAEAAALFEQAEQAEGQNRLDEAYAFFVKLADSYPRTTHAPEALLAAARIEDRRGHAVTRDALLRRLQADYPGSHAALGAKSLAPGR